MDISSKYCVYSGSTRGSLLWTYCKQDEKFQYRIPENQSEVTALSWGRSEDEIVIGYKNEQVQIFNITQEKYVKTIKNLEGEGPVVGVAPLDNKSIIIAKEEGIITIWNGKNSDYFSIDLEEKASLNAIYYNNNRANVLGTGGEVNDFKLWDLETKKCIFKAKSLGHDELNLPIPTSVRSITALAEHEFLYACATKEGHVLLYDERAQRRPVTKFLEKQASYTCIASAFKERQCLVGTTKGYLQLLDLKAPGKCLKTITNFTGSITSIACDPVNNVVVTSSLDRFLRINNLETKELLHKVYMKQSLTKILIKPLVKEESEDEEKDKDEISAECDELFDNMEAVIEPTSLKRKKQSEKIVKKRKIENK